MPYTPAQRPVDCMADEPERHIGHEKTRALRQVRASAGLLFLHAPKELNFRHISGTRSVGREQLDFQVLRLDGRKFELLIWRLEQLDVLGLKLADGFEGAGRRIAANEQLELLDVELTGPANQHREHVQSGRFFILEGEDRLNLIGSAIDVIGFLFAVDCAGPSITGGDYHLPPFSGARRLIDFEAGWVETGAVLDADGASDFAASPRDVSGVVKGALGTARASCLLC